MRRPRCGDGSYILVVSVTDAELVMLVAHGSALAALGDVVGCAGIVCRVSWCPIALLPFAKPGSVGWPGLVLLFFYRVLLFFLLHVPPSTRFLSSTNSPMRFVRNLVATPQ